MADSLPSQPETLEWITGNDPDLEYYAAIGDGGYGEVHKVSYRIRSPTLY